MESTRSPSQILVFPFRRMQDRIEYLVLKRSDLGIWQGVAGGGEYDVARSLLKWDSNKTALWELHERIENSML